MDLSELDSKGLSAMHLAAERGATDAVEYLFDQGVDINIRSSYGNTPLMLACKENKVETVALILDLGGNISFENKTGYNAFHFAAEGDHSEVISAIGRKLQGMEYEDEVSEGQDDDLLDEQDEEREADDDRTERDSNFGENVTETEVDGNDYEKFMKREAEHKATRNIKFGSLKDSTKASMRNSTKSVNISAKDAVHSSTGSKAPKNMFIFNAVNFASHNRSTPLHVAAIYNCGRAAEALIALGATLNEQDSSGETPLHKVPLSTHICMGNEPPRVGRSL